MRKLPFALTLIAASIAHAQTPVIGTPPTHAVPSYDMPPAKFWINPNTFIQPQFGQSANTVGVGCVGLHDNCTFAATDITGSGAGGGAFRINCAYSHIAYDDPIVFPGQPGLSHPHIFFGNTSTNYASVLDNQAFIGNSTCDGGIANRTGYWVPVYVYSCPNPVLSGCDGTRDGEVQIPASAGNGLFLVYYKGGGNPLLPDENAWQWPSPKLRMIAGNSKATALQGQTDGNFTGICYTATHVVGGGVPGDDGMGGWYGHFPTSWNAAQVDQCDEISNGIVFPQCQSDTLDKDSPDHQSHMRYWTSNTSGDPTHGACDTPGFTVPIPHITFNVHYRPKFIADLDYMRLSSDPPEQYGTTQTSVDTTHIKLAGTEPATNDWYKSGVLFIGGVPRTISAYDGTTKIATVTAAFGSLPSVGTKYAIRQAAGLTMHGDWVNGWNQTDAVANTGGKTVADIIRDWCIRGARNCGTDGLGAANPAAPPNTNTTQWFWMPPARR